MGDKVVRAAGVEWDLAELFDTAPPGPDPLVTLDLCRLRRNSGTADGIAGDEGYVLGAGCGPNPAGYWNETEG